MSVFGIDRLILQLTERSAAHMAKQWLFQRMGRSEGRSLSARARAFGNEAAVAEDGMGLEPC